MDVREKYYTTIIDRILVEFTKCKLYHYEGFKKWGSKNSYWFINPQDKTWIFEINMVDSILWINITFYQDIVRKYGVEEEEFKTIMLRFISNIMGGIIDDFEKLWGITPLTGIPENKSPLVTRLLESSIEC